MVNRIFLIPFICLFFVQNLFALNILKKIEVNGNILALHFNNSLKREDFKASAIAKKSITKYYFDFKKCKLNKNIKRVININGNVKSIRSAQYKKDIVRVVIDSKKSYKVRYYQKDKPIFFITLPENTKNSKKKNSKKISPKALFTNVKTTTNKNNNTSINTKEKKVLKISKLKHNYTIVIDAGHGGKDPGAVSGGKREKDIVLSISKRVYRQLRTLGFRVKMTRNSNKYLTLGRRTRMANRYKADLFVSIHANSVKNRSRREKAYGIETYFLSQARNARAKRIAARENRMLLKSMDRTTKEVLLNTVFTGPKIVLSNKLALDVQRGILNSLRESYSRVKDNGVRGAPFYVLVGAQMPSILIEVGYISNSRERKRLISPIYQEKLAKGIVEGIINYLKNRERELE